MIDERVLIARRKLLEAVIALGVEITPDLEWRFFPAWQSYVTGKSELPDLRKAFGEFRRELFERARAEWGAELQQKEDAA